MAVSGAIFGKGTELSVETTLGAGDYSANLIAEVKSISGPTLEAEEVDVTNQDSDGDFREFKRGLVDGGEVTFEINFQPALATHDQLFTDLTTGDVKGYKVSWNPLGVPFQMTFNAFVKSMPVTSPVDNVLTANITLRVSGATSLEAFSA